MKTAVALSLLLFTSCAALDKQLDVVALAGEIAVAGGYVTTEEHAKLTDALAVAELASATAQSQAERAEVAAAELGERIEAADDETDWGTLLGLAGVIGVAARGVPSKGLGRAVVRMLTPKPVSSMTEAEMTAEIDARIRRRTGAGPAV